MCKITWKEMYREYKVTRKLQEQGGSYFVVLPKLWVESRGLKQGDSMSVFFNGIVKIKPPPDSSTCSSGDTRSVLLTESINAKGGENE